MDSFQYFLHSPRFIFPRSRRIAKIAGNSTIHIYKSAAEFKGTLSLPPSLALSFSPRCPAFRHFRQASTHRVRLPFARKPSVLPELRTPLSLTHPLLSTPYLPLPPIYIVKQNPRGRDLSAAVERDAGADRCGADRGITDPACPRGRKSERT